jgi:excisionase family DNA binding protein
VCIEPYTCTNSNTGTKGDTVSAEKQLLTVKEVCEEYGLHQNTVRDYYRTGKLPAVNLGPRMIRIRRSDIEQLFTPYEPPTSAG